VITGSESHVVLSPHFDDAVLSRGALISHWRRTGAAVTVVTVFTASPVGPLSIAAQEDRRRYGGADPSAVREEEDQCASSLLSFDRVFLDLPEVLHRRRPDGRPRCQDLNDIFGGLEPGDDAVIEQVADALSAVLTSTSPAYFHVPLGIGDHIDHQIARRGAEAAWGAAEEHRPRLAYYEELPYAFTTGPRDDVAYSWPVDDADIERWIEAIECYPSQIEIMFREEWATSFRRWPALSRSVAPH